MSSLLGRRHADPSVHKDDRAEPIRTVSAAGAMKSNLLFCVAWMRTALPTRAVLVVRSGDGARQVLVPRQLVPEFPERVGRSGAGRESERSADASCVWLLEWRGGGGRVGWSLGNSFRKRGGRSGLGVNSNRLSPA